MTPIHLAAKNGCTDMVQTLIEKNANVNCKDKVWYILCYLSNLNYFSLTVLLCILDVMQKRVILIL